MVHAGAARCDLLPGRATAAFASARRHLPLGTDRRRFSRASPEPHHPRGAKPAAAQKVAAAKAKPAALPA
jgi:hypothetical protein